MGLLDRVNAAARGEIRYSTDTYLNQYLLPANQFTYNGTVYPFGLNTTWTQSRTKEVTNSLPGYLGALRSCPPAFAAQLVRALVLSQARFVFRNRPTSATPRRTFGTRDLSVLERPWRNATTGQMLARMEWHAGLAGNAYVVRQPDRLRVLRPDWVAILYGSDLEPDNPMHALDGEVIGYVYQNGGVGSGGRITTLLPEDVAHWSPMPDPERAEIGMSWITPAIREIQADRAATEHTLQFFAHGATPNMVVKGIPAATKEQFNEIVDAMEERHAGVTNAYRTLYLTAGADATVVGANLSEINLTGVQGASETRITYLSRVPATLLGIAAGLEGSSLNAGNFSQARRTFSDSWVYPSLQDLSAALAPLVKVPNDAELWFDVSDIPLLREDASDAANIMQVKATTITTYVKEGFTPESAIAAVRAQDETLLKHSGMVSVQLQPPGSTAASAPGVPPMQRGRELRKFDPNEPRRPDGKWGSGGAIHKLLKSLHDTSSHSGVYYDDEDYIDWSSRKKDGSFTLEFGGDGGETALLDATPDEMATWQEALTDSLRDRISNGISVGERGSLDWEPVGGGDRWDFRVTSDDGEEVAYDWSAARMQHLHTALTTTLLADAIGHPDGTDRAQRLVESLRTVGLAVSARADTHPGKGNAKDLHEYWTKGEGLAKWAESPKPWTTLVAHLSKFLPPEEAKKTAANWFHDVFHFWPGADLNRVTHGKPPRGNKIGPG